MACNKNYNFVLDLSNIPQKENTKLFDWKNSVGCVVSFSSNKLCGNLEIIKYIQKHIISDNSYLIVKYKNDILSPITVSGFKNGKLGGILQKYLFEWAYEIGDIIIDENKDITIIDRKYDNGRQYYKIKCNKCGYDCGEHYLNQIYKKELWINKEHLKALKSCPCCGESTIIVVPGINDIPTTDLWLTHYFQGGYDEAKKYRSSSQKRIYPICPYCNTISKKSQIIQNIKKNRGFLCICNDKISFPNKFIYHLFDQLKEDIDYFNTEFQPDWLKPYRYDLYFEINNKKYAIEMDGGVGHGNKKYKSNEKDIDGLKRDIEKDRISKENEVTIIRIDCLKSDFEYIKNNVNKCLNNIINLSTIDWDLLELKCLSNFTKEICECYNKTLSLKETAKLLNISNGTIINALDKGNKFGWCSYIKLKDQKQTNIEKCIKIIDENPEYSVKDVANCLNLKYTTVLDYLNSIDEYRNFLQRSKEKGAEKRRINAIKRNSKTVYVYDLKMNFLGEYCSQNELERRSLNDFGVILRSKAISRVCTGERKQYKGYIFSFIKLHND